MECGSADFRVSQSPSRSTAAGGGAAGATGAAGAAHGGGDDQGLPAGGDQSTESGGDEAQAEPGGAEPSAGGSAGDPSLGGGSVDDPSLGGGIPPVLGGVDIPLGGHDDTAQEGTPTTAEVFAALSHISSQCIQCHGENTQDPEAGYNVKAGSDGKVKTTYGYKAHVSVDEDDFIKAYGNHA